MEIKDLEIKLAEASALLVTLRSQYESARRAYLSELERDCERSPGSGAQERRREENQAELRDAQWKAETTLNEQLMVVKQLTEQFLSKTTK